MEGGVQFVQIEYNLFEKFFFNISNLKAGTGGGGGGTLMSLYTESQKIKLLYCLNAVSYFKEKYCY